MTSITQGWHLKKEVTIGQILTIFAMGLSFAVWEISQEARLTKVEAAANNLASRVDRSERRTGEDLREIKASVSRIEDYLIKR